MAESEYDLLAREFATVQGERDRALAQVDELAAEVGRLKGGVEALVESAVYADFSMFVPSETPDDEACVPAVPASDLRALLNPAPASQGPTP